MKKNFFTPLAAAFFLPLGFSAVIHGQTTITIGTGTATNSSTTFPAPYGAYAYGARHQILIRASELIAQGMCAGNITALGFDVATPHGGGGNCGPPPPLNGFTIKMKLTANTSVSSFETGLTTVYGPLNFMETSGWNTHTFSVPFAWDGVSNLLIETCFQNGCWASNALMRYTQTTFNSVVYYRAWAANVCNTNTITALSSFRPNMRITFSGNVNPPNVNFTVNTTFVCLGNSVQFTDLSSCGPNQWLWNFGDATTSTQQNPSHTYANPGVYSVTLTATNNAGSNTLTMTNYITVGSGSPPVACSVTCLNPNFGFGITNFTFDNINNNTGNSQQEGGYRDFSCANDSVLLGSAYNMSISTPSPAAHNVRVWIDWNNDASFNPTTELVLSGNSTLLTSGTVFIPTTATLNTPLRIRVSANHDLYPAPGPCTNVDAGQIEDYGIVVLPNNQAPVANFTASPLITCDGVVNFTDLSLNIPTSWLWNFGDANTSFLQNPAHTYTASGTYSVTLIVSNTNGSDTIVMPNYITVILNGMPVTPACAPATFSYCCQYGIYNVQFNTINHPSADGSEGYKDFSCDQRTNVLAGQSYPVTISTSTVNPQDTKVWIDWNNDGSFNNTNELVLTSNNSYNPTGNVTIPLTALQNVPLRMRAASDYSGSNPQSCGPIIQGQAEDYTVIITGTVGLDFVNNENFLNVYPNPSADGKFNVEFLAATNGDVTISVFTLTGNEIYHKIHAGNSAVIDLSEYSNGIYFLRAAADNGRSLIGVRKIVIQ
jgi:PKD repeat protein